MRKEYEITRSEYLNIDWVANKREEVNRILVEQVSKSDLASMKKVLEQKEQFDQVLQVFMESLEHFLKPWNSVKKFTMCF